MVERSIFIVHLGPFNFRYFHFHYFGLWLCSEQEVEVVVLPFWVVLPQQEELPQWVVVEQPVLVALLS